MAKSLKNMMGGGLGAQSASLINGVVVDGLTATGSTQVDALPLTSDVNVVGTVPSGSGVMLPAIPQPGDECVIANLGSNALNVYPGAGGSIQGAAANAAYQLAIGAAASFVARTGSQNWAVLSSGGSISAPGGAFNFSVPANSGLLLLLEEM